MKEVSSSRLKVTLFILCIDHLSQSYVLCLFDQPLPLNEIVHMGGGELIVSFEGGGIYHLLHNIGVLECHELLQR